MTLTITVLLVPQFTGLFSFKRDVVGCRARSYRTRMERTDGMYGSLPHTLPQYCVIF